MSNQDCLTEPNFLIIGAEKCGTSSLYQYIIEHPHVLGAIEKEIHFFTYNFDKGLDWYRSHFYPLAQNSNYITGEARLQEKLALLILLVTIMLLKES